MDMQNVLNQLEPTLNKQGILVFMYNGSEIKEKFPRFFEISNALAKYTSSKEITESTDLPVTTNLLETMQLFETAKTRQEIMDLFKNYFLSYIEIQKLYYKEFENSDEDELHNFEKAAVMQLEVKFFKQVQRVAEEFSVA